jgi:alkyl sulfatase BDS1-like metallo-beta-lactamase superfamily hydrolase
MADEKNKPERIQAVQVIAVEGVEFSDPIPDVHVASQPISGCAWVETDEGIVLIDTMLSRKAAAQVLEKIRESGKKIEYIIYTHHHLDHIGGCQVFMEDNPKVIANEYLPGNLDRYKRQATHRGRIAAQQFNLPEVPTTGEGWVYPTETFSGEKTIKLGGKTFELRTTRAETDDVCWVWVPEMKAAFVGDVMIGSFPNIGNPWKPTRFAYDWIKTLEAVRAKEPEYIFYSGAGKLRSGEVAREALDHNIEAMHSLHDQVVDLINQDVHISEMIHMVKLPDHLKDSPYLQSNYSRPEFFVYNTYRWYHGYFDHNPAHLLPRPEKEVAGALFEIIGDEKKILDKAKALLADGQAQLGLQVLDVLIQAEPESIEVRKLRVEILEELGSADYCLMSRNSWVYFIDRDKEFLKSKGAI